jgi:glycosyltransferase involved in cell wall biosynthesis
MGAGETVTSQHLPIESLSIVVPVFNSQTTLAELVERIEGVFGPRRTALEILLVNDGSQDRSWEVIRELAERHSCVRGLNLMRNYGQHNALFAGIRRARFEAIVTMDDDLQHPPEEIPRLLAKLEEGYDVVYGTPEKDHHSWWRNVASKLTKLALQTAMKIEIAQSTSAFRALRSKVMDAFRDFDGPFVDIDALLGWGTERFAILTVSHGPRRVGTSQYTFWSLVAHGLNMIVCFSTLPLRLVSISGFFFTLFGFAVLAYVVGRYFLQGSEPGFPFLASLIALFSGAQLFALGLIGEYLARTHFRSMGRPGSLLRETTEQGAAPPSGPAR